MKLTAARIKIAAFVLIVAAPLLALAVLGAVSPYGQRPHPPYPKARALVNGKQGAFDQLGQAILDRSAVTKEAIRLKYTLNYGVSHYVDTDLVVSGREDWLFLKDDFSKQFVCMDEARMARDLAQIDVMTDMAAAAGLRMFVSVSPDKSSIYPEYLHPLARRYWACKSDSAAMLRRLMTTQAPRIIDHAVPLMAEKARSGTTNLFWHQDTHWTFYGAAFARRQLFEAVAGHLDAVVPPPKLTGQQAQRESDLGNLMLLLPNRELYDETDIAVEQEADRIYATKPAPHTVMLVDSFYGVGAFNDPAVFPGIREFHVDKNDEAVVGALADAKNLIINSVERSLLARIEQGALSWRSVVGRGVLARNAAAAQACTEFEKAAIKAGDGRAVVDVPALGEGRLPCVRITVNSPGADVEITLPARSGNTYMSDFAEGRALRQTIAPGKQVMTFVMPAYVAGRLLGFKAGAGGQDFSAQSIEVGSTAVPDSSN